MIGANSCPSTRGSRRSASSFGVWSALVAVFAILCAASCQNAADHSPATARAAKSPAVSAAPTTSSASSGTPTPPLPPAEVLFSVRTNPDVSTPAGVFAVRSDGADVRSLTGAPSLPETEVSRRLGLITYAKAIDGVATDGCGYLEFIQPTQGIAVAALDGTHERLLTRGSCDSTPTFSPDGSLIAFVRFQHQVTDLPPPQPSHSVIMIIDATTGQIVHQLSPPPRVYDTSPVWSPDSRAIAVVRRDFSRVDGPPSTGIVIEPLDGSPPVALPGAPLTAGTPLLTGGHRSQSDNVYGRSGPLFGDSAEGLAWSHDGRYIAEVRTDGQLWVQPTDGGPSRQLTHFPNGPGAYFLCGLIGGGTLQVSHPIWSPDDTQVAFISNARHLYEFGLAFDVYVEGSDGSGLRVAEPDPPSPGCRHGATNPGLLPSPVIDVLGWVR